MNAPAELLSATHCACGLLVFETSLGTVFEAHGNAFLEPFDGSTTNGFSPRYAIRRPSGLIEILQTRRVYLEHVCPLSAPEPRILPK